MGKIISTMRQVVCFPIRCYQQFMRPCLRPCCRFHPSCSDYALQAIEHDGVGKGIVKTCYRLLRCHPWSKGGFDPVIPIKEK